MAGQAGYHLGNCDAFTSVMKKPRKGDVKPTGVFHGFASVLVGHRLYVCGGSLGSHVSSAVFVCNLKLNVWNRLDVANTQGAPGRRTVRACFVHNDALSVFALGDHGLLSVYLLDLILAKQWRVVTPRGIGYMRSSSVGAYHENSGEVFLSDGEGLYVFRNEDMQGRVRETRGRKPGRRRRHGCCMSSSSFFLLGGNGNARSGLHVLSLDAMSWTTVSHASTYASMSRRICFSMSYCNGRIFVMGGYPVRQMTDQLDVFEIKQQRWKCIYSAIMVGRNYKLELVGNLFGGTRGHSAVVTRDKLIVLGGHGSKFKHLRLMQVSPLVKSSR